MGRWMSSLGRISITWSSLHIVAALALVLVACQLLFGKTADPIGTREALIKPTGYCTIIFLTGQLTTDLPARAWHWLGFSIVVYVFVISTFTIVQFFSSPGAIYWIVKPRWSNLVYGPYVNRNHYAGLLELLLPFALGLILELSISHPLKSLTGFSILLGFASVLLSGSRGGTMAAIVELLIFSALIITSGISGSRRLPLVMLIALPALALAMFAALDSGDVLKRWEETARGELAAEFRTLWRTTPCACGASIPEQGLAREL